MGKWLVPDLYQWKIFYFILLIKISSDLFFTLKSNYLELRSSINKAWKLPRNIQMVEPFLLSVFVFHWFLLHIFASLHHFCFLHNIYNWPFEFLKVKTLFFAQTCSCWFKKFHSFMENEGITEDINIELIQLNLKPRKIFSANG